MPPDRGAAGGGCMWIFGYGSLIWRPDFPFVERRPARLHGWSRRFWQGSTDHRGRPGAPGRVVTLIADPCAHCDGLAYAVSPDRSNAVLAQLDHREQGGYVRIDAPLSLQDGRTVAGVVYVARPDNANFLGQASLTGIACQVRGANGPSGANIDYVLRLDAALRSLGVVDPHVSNLAALLDRPAG